MPVLTVDADSFVDTATAFDNTTHFVTAPFARIQVSTTATSVDVSIFNDISAFGSLDRVGVYVNGAYNQQINTAAGASTVTITLPAGSKLVDFVNGPTTHDDGTNAEANLTGCAGAWITALDFNAAFTQIFPTGFPKVVIWGDSIAVGDGSTGTPAGDVHQKAWTMQTRLAYEGDIAVEAWGYRSLFDDASTSTKRARFVALMVVHNPAILVMTCGTNDYGLPKLSAASYGTAYGALLDDVHAALPNTKIVVVSPVTRDPETANGFGNTLQDYRDQASAVAAARPGYVSYIDGSTIIDVGDLADGVHPNGGGHTKIKNVVLPYLQDSVQVQFSVTTS